MTKLLDATKMLSINNSYLLDLIRCTIADRLSWQEDREPESDGTVHDEWDEKIDALTEIIETIDNAEEITSDLLDEVSDLIFDYQMTYGGLSRLKID